MNSGVVSVDEKHVATVDYERLKVASGVQDTPKVAVTYSVDDNQYTFTQQSQVEEDGYALADDLVYAVLFESVLKRVKLITLRKRGEGGSTSFALPEGWDHAMVKAYCFATVKNGRCVSDSLSLTIGYFIS